jgi:hypothetical protein
MAGRKQEGLTSAAVRLKQRERSCAEKKAATEGREAGSWMRDRQRHHPLSSM